VSIADTPTARRDRRAFDAETTERLAWLLDTMTRDLRTERHARRKATLTRQTAIIREILDARTAAEQQPAEEVVETPAPAPKLTAATVTRIVRTATGSDLFTSRAEPSIGVVRVSQRYAVAGALASADTRDRRDARARAAAAALIQAGYEVARSGDSLTVTLPEPEETVDELLDRVRAEHPSVDRKLARDEERARHEEAATRRAVDAEDGTDGLVHLMSDDLLDACGSAGPGGLHLAPSSTPERITCPRCLVLGVEEEVERLGYEDADAYLRACGRSVELRERYAGATAEADLPPTDEDRVAVPIKARELRVGDLVVGPTGFVAYAVFDTDAGTHIADGRLVRVWTAIRDQERGLPPVVEVPAERELRVLRPLSEEGRELLAALDRV
jgi:hypothetical protein